MGLSDIVRSGIATARSITLPLHVNVIHAAWTGQNQNGDATYAAPVVRKGLVERKQQVVRTSTGQEITARSYVAFLEEVAPNGASDRVEPIDDRDVIILPDGTTGPILATDGFFDGGTGVPYYSQVYLG
jgi:hypothetical protein